MSDRDVIIFLIFVSFLQIILPVMGLKGLDEKDKGRLKLNCALIAIATMGLLFFRNDIQIVRTISILLLIPSSSVRMMAEKNLDKEKQKKHTIFSVLLMIVLIVVLIVF